MTTYNTITKQHAKALGRNLSISTKQSIEVCNHIRGKSVVAAEQFLEAVLIKKEAVPMRRFNRDTAHKPGIGPGKYPINTCKEILAILRTARSNALDVGLGNDLVIYHIAAHKASTPWHYGRARRRKMKRTHIEIVLTQATTKKSSSSKKTKNVPSKEKDETKSKTVDSKPVKKVSETKKPAEKTSPSKKSSQTPNSKEEKPKNPATKVEELKK